MYWFIDFHLTFWQMVFGLLIPEVLRWPQVNYSCHNEHS